MQNYIKKAIPQVLKAHLFCSFWELFCILGLFYLILILINYCRTGNMGNELNNIVSSEYFYLETDMAFMRREAFVFDKFIIVFVEKGTARVAVGDNEYHIDSYRMLVLRPDSPTRLVRSSEGFRVVLMGFMPVMLHEHTRRIEPNFFLMIYTRMAWKLSFALWSVETENGGGIAPRMRVWMRKQADKPPYAIHDRSATRPLRGRIASAYKISTDSNICFMAIRILLWSCRYGPCVPTFSD